MKAVLAFLVVGSAFTMPYQGIQVKIESQPVNFDVPPMMRGRTVVVPIRSLLEAMGGTLKWNMSTNTLSGWKNGKKFDVVLNSREALLNDKKVILEEGAFIKHDRIYVPLKFAADATGYLISTEDGAFVLRPTARS